MFTRLTLAAGALLAVAAAKPAAAQTYNFDLGGDWFDATPATITSTGGYTVSFSSTNDANGGFTIGNNAGLFNTLGAQVLEDTNTSGDTLTLNFGQTIYGLNFTAAIIDLLGINGDDTLTVSDGLVSANYTATVGSGGLFPEENVAFADAAGFNSVTITGTEAFAIGLSDVPEPASLAAFGIGLLGLTTLRRRRAA